ncbi:hybrid sensor histidine kinase/response regulator [Massilia horti]|uniref:Chemotaxis protein CheA n=1 Tax=Massilia horti TaxID=2562153 RepID=A0A4Y9T4T2_9BURK|nr:response regulator [Massilia horti]TFW35346.1 hybrid sensor histidine kinase/response regulator [Massilia horti]
MSEPTQAFLQRLRAIFADEAREHLQQIEAGLLGLEQTGAPAYAALTEQLLKTLHTLKGAARSVDLDALERLCHALEGALTAAAGAPGALGASDFDCLYQCVAVARELAGSPAGRVRNQAVALCAQLELLAARLQGAPVDGALPAAAPEDDSPAPAAPASAAPEALRGLVRVDAALLDTLRAEVEDLLGAELRFAHQAAELRTLAAEMAQQRRTARGVQAAAAGPELRCARLAGELDATCADMAAARRRLMGAVLEAALVPFATVFDELPALVRKLARSRGREVVLSVEGERLLVDRRVAAALREALIHLVTNAVDHGIEPPAQRVDAGKPGAGTLRVSAIQRDTRQVLVRVLDDGAGLDVEALARAAGVELAALQQMGEHERLRLALRPGVSTAAQVTPVSGRGLGLAVVAGKVAQVGGTLTIDSAPGRGCSFELLLPVSLASLRAVVVQAAGQRYALPLSALASVRTVTLIDVQTVGNRETVVVGDRVLPLVRLGALFGAAPSAQAGGVALVAAGDRPFALLVDEIVAEQDVLPRHLGPLLRRVRYFSGATLLGDGALVPLIALDDIGAAAPVSNEAACAHDIDAGARRVLVVEDSVTSRVLLKHILEGAGYLAETAADGLEALSRLRQGRFDAVVSDVEMPHMDGLALTAAIRAARETAELPVILVTSLQTPEERERGLHAGADAYLTKGAFDQDRLLATLRRLA